MDSFFELLLHNSVLAVIFVIANFFLSIQLINLVVVSAGRKATEAMGSRGKAGSLYLRCSVLVRRTIKKVDRKDKKPGYYARAAAKMKRSGYSGEYAPAIYLLLKFGVSSLLFITAFLLNFPDMLPALVAAAGMVAIIESVLAVNRKNINMKLQKYMYKIYKYLHNQISSGVRVVDALRTAYEVIDDKKLRSILVRFAAYYELTLDVDKALEEFRMNFDAHEAETLCVVLKQGIETGDNQDLLARQEEVMFKKYFNTIQAETDSCKNRCLMAAVMYTAVIVLMIIIPLLNDTSAALGKIFLN